MMRFTGERYVPELRGQISYEHLHRYALAKELAAGCDVLDVASGEGYGAAFLATVARSVVGVDADADTVRHAASRYTAMNLRFKVSVASDLPFADESFDLVVSFETIEHLAEHDDMMREIVRVLRPNGKLIISSPNRLVYSDLPGYRNPFHVRELYFDEFRDLLARYFGSSAIYGHRVFAASAVHPLNGIVGEPAWLGTRRNGAERGLPALPDPTYFIAVCTRQSTEAAAELSSVYLDITQDLLRQMFDDTAMPYVPRIAGDTDVEDLPLALMSTNAGAGPTNGSAHRGVAASRSNGHQREALPDESALLALADAKLAQREGEVTAAQERLAIAQRQIDVTTAERDRARDAHTAAKREADDQIAALAHERTLRAAAERDAAERAALLADAERRLADGIAHAESRTTTAQTQARDAESRAVAAQTQARDAESRAAAAQTQAREAESRAAAAYAQAGDAESRAAAAQAESRDAESRAAAAQVQANEAESRAANAVREAESRIANAVRVAEELRLAGERDAAERVADARRRLEESTGNNDARIADAERRLHEAESRAAAAVRETEELRSTAERVAAENTTHLAETETRIADAQARAAAERTALLADAERRLDEERLLIEEYASELKTAFDKHAAAEARVAEAESRAVANAAAASRERTTREELARRLDTALAAVAAAEERAAQSEAGLEAMKRKLGDVRDALRAASQRVDDSARRHTALEAELADAQARIERYERERAVVREARRRAAETELERHGLKLELKQRDERIAVAHAAIGDLRAELAARASVGATVRERDEQLAAIGARLHDRDERLRTLQAEYDRIAGALHEIVHSRSWRMSEPMRRLRLSLGFSRNGQGAD